MSFPIFEFLSLALIVYIIYSLLRSKKGKPMVCATCGHLGKTTQVTRGSIWIEIILWCFFILPGVIYSLWRLTTRKQACTACHGEALVPPDSPVGRKLLAEHGAQPVA